MFFLFLSLSFTHFFSFSHFVICEQLNTFWVGFFLFIFSSFWATTIFFFLSSYFWASTLFYKLASFYFFLLFEQLFNLQVTVFISFFLFEKLPYLESYCLSFLLFEQLTYFASYCLSPFLFFLFLLVEQLTYFASNCFSVFVLLFEEIAFFLQITLSLVLFFFLSNYLILQITVYIFFLLLFEQLRHFERYYISFFVYSPFWTTNVFCKLHSFFLFPLCEQYLILPVKLFLFLLFERRPYFE